MDTKERESADVAANRDGDFDEYCRWLVLRTARNLIHCAGFTREDLDDLDRELTVDLIARLPKFDPALGRRKSFISRVVKNKAANLVASRRSAQKGFTVEHQSLNDVISDADGNQFEAGDRIDDDERLPDRFRTSRSSEDARELVLDVERTISLLPPDLAEIAERLKHSPVARIAKDLGLSRAALYRKLKHIRTHLERAGLASYVRAGRTL